MNLFEELLFGCFSSTFADDSDLLLEFFYFKVVLLIYHILNDALIFSLHQLENDRLIFFTYESTFDAHSLVSDFFSTVICDSLLPISLLILISLNRKLSVESFFRIIGLRCLGGSIIVARLRTIVLNKSASRWRLESNVIELRNIQLVKIVSNYL